MGGGASSTCDDDDGSQSSSCQTVHQAGKPPRRSRLESSNAWVQVTGATTRRCVLDRRWTQPFFDKGAGVLHVRSKDLAHVQGADVEGLGALGVDLNHPYSESPAL